MAKSPAPKRPVPSGAAKRKKARVAGERDLREGEGELTSLEKTWLRRYKRLGPPPKDTVGGIAWANQVTRLLLWETLTDPGIEPRERRRVGGDLVAKLGMTGVKSLYEERFIALEAAVYGKKGKSNGGLTEFKPEQPG